MTVCDALVENVRLLVNGIGVPLFVSEEKMKSVKSHSKVTHYYYLLISSFCMKNDIHNSLSCLSNQYGI